MPDYDFARREARKATEDTLKLLAATWKLGNNGLERPNDRFQFTNDLKEELLQVIEKIFISEACNSW